MATRAANIVRKPARTTLGMRGGECEAGDVGRVGLFEKGGIRLELEDEEGISL